MNDLLKILGGAASGFIFGLASDPIKVIFQERRKIKRLEDALADEMIYLALTVAVPLHHQPRNWQTSLLETPRYDHYLAKETESLLRLRHYNQIDSFYKSIHAAKQHDNDFDAILDASGGILLLHTLLHSKSLRPAFRRLAKRSGKELMKAAETAQARHTLGKDDDDPQLHGGR